METQANNVQVPYEYPEPAAPLQGDTEAEKRAFLRMKKLVLEDEGREKEVAAVSTEDKARLALYK